MQLLSIGHQGENVIILIEIVGHYRDLALFIAEQFKRVGEDLVKFVLLGIDESFFYYLCKNNKKN